MGQGLSYRETLCLKHITGWTALDIGRSCYERSSTLTVRKPYKQCVLRFRSKQFIPFFEERLHGRTTVECKRNVNFLLAPTVTYNGSVIPSNHKTKIRYKFFYLFRSRAIYARRPVVAKTAACYDTEYPSPPLLLQFQREWEQTTSKMIWSLWGEPERVNVLSWRTNHAWQLGLLLLSAVPWAW